MENLVQHLKARAKSPGQRITGLRVTSVEALSSPVPCCSEEEGASRVLARIREGLAAHNAQHPDNPLSISFGTATVHPHEPLDAALRLADERMY